MGEDYGSKGEGDESGVGVWEFFDRELRRRIVWERGSEARGIMGRASGLKAFAKEEIMDS